MRQRKAPSIASASPLFGGEPTSGRAKKVDLTATADAYKSSSSLKGQMLGRAGEIPARKQEQANAEDIIKRRAKAERLKTAIGGNSFR